MENRSTTALVCAFARAYHSEHNQIRIFDDPIAGKLIRPDEKEKIAHYMTQGRKFFYPSFSGTDEEALRMIVDGFLSPSVLGRAAFAENALRTAVSIGAEQYLILAAGYDTFAYRQPEWAERLQIFEFDRSEMLRDKRKRLSGVTGLAPANLNCIPVDLTKANIAGKIADCPEFDIARISFCSMLGIIYYISRDIFKNIIENLSKIMPQGSSLAFDYPDEKTYTIYAGERAKKQAALALGAGEAMLSSYSYKDMETILSDCGFLIYEHLDPDEITERYFHEYNLNTTGCRMTAFDNVHYCLAVKQQR